MKILLLHQNFPGQFRQLTPHLLNRGHELVAICSHQRPYPETKGLRIIRYPEPDLKDETMNNGSPLWNEALQRAELVGCYLQKLADEGWSPDRVLVHCGWGEALPVKEIWPKTALIVWPELWLSPEHMGYGSDPQKIQYTTINKLSCIGRNALTAASLSQANAWVLPTQHQANSFPSAFRSERLHVIHEGIDSQLACPNPDVSYEVRGISVDRSVPTITFVNRNLERLRGFDMFLRSVALIQQQHSTVRVIVVGDNERGYGEGHPSGRPLKEVMLQELHDELDLQRIHFLGRVPHSVLISILQASWIHVYLSYPFIMGWSLLEAMSCGCCIVGSQGAPVNEVIHDGVQGLLVPMDDHKRLAQRVLALLENAHLRKMLGASARESALLWDQKVMLPKLTSLIENIN